MKLLGFLLGTVFFLGTGQFVFAATLYIDPAFETINRGDSITLSVRLDTDEGECINAVDGVITYTENIVPIDTSRGQSIFSVWVEPPVIDKQNRTITFAAGIPNGYCGRIVGDPRLTNNVVDLVFSSPGLQIGSTESGNEARIEFASNSRALLNDGFGTDAPLQLFGSTITLNEKAGSQIENEWLDIVADDFTPPEEFSIALEQSPNAFNGKYFIVFNTTDKQSGIDYYEVIEESSEAADLFTWGAVDAPWVKAQSPYVLDDQSLNSVIKVRAYDKAGNEYIATFVPEEGMRTISTQDMLLLVLIGTIVLTLFVGGVMYVIFRRRFADYEDDYEDE